MNDDQNGDGFLKRLKEHPEAARRGLLSLKDKLAEESQETAEMLRIYRRSLNASITDDERRQAHAQFLDLLRLAGMAAFCSVVPGSSLGLPFAVAGARRFGIRLLPSAFEPESADEE